MGGDRRATMGNLISSRDIEKVYPADSYSVIGIAGAAGIAIEMVRLYQVELEHYEKIEGITLSMDGKAIAVGGQTVSGAVDVVSTVTGEKTGSPALFRLDPGVTLEQFGAFMQSKASQDLNNAGKLGQIVFDADAHRGTSSAETVLQPGQYVALDAGQSQSSNAIPPHTAFTVTQSPAPAALPKPQATVRAIEFGFRGPRTLRRGEVVRFVNDGFLVHMIVGIEAPSHAAAKRIDRLLRRGHDKQAQRLARGGVGFEDPVSPGGLVQMKLDAKPGWWVLACFMDTQDHREHTQLGMERVIHIAR
jgi:hypothetical protein